MRTKGSYLRTILGLAFLSTALSREAFAGTYKAWWLPPSVSSYGADLDKLFYIILAITSITFFLVQGTLLVFLIKYRSKPGRKAAFIHGNHKAEIIWTIIPALILAWLAFYQQSSWAYIKENFPLERDAFVVKATGQQFEWHFFYAGRDGTFDTSDDIETINQLHVPINKPILVKISSKDVIHSFFLPEFRVKQDAVPGLVVPTWFKAIKLGTYDIACAELCGLGHYRMKGFLNVLTPEDLDKKLNELYAEKEANTTADFWK